MRTNRIANLENDESGLGYIAGTLFIESFYTLTLNENGKFQLFFDEDAYRAEMNEEFKEEVEEEALLADCVFLTDIELELGKVGGV